MTELEYKLLWWRLLIRSGVLVLLGAGVVALVFLFVRELTADANTAALKI